MELILVILITGIVAAIAAPRFADVQVFDEFGFAEELAAATRYAQKYAIATTCPVTLAVTTAGYALNRAPNFNTCQSAAATAAVLRPDASNQPFAASVPLNVSIGGAAPVNLVFGANGDVSRTTDALLTIGPYTITVRAVTGYVEGP